MSTEETSRAIENEQLHQLIIWYKRRDEALLRLNSRFRAAPDLSGVLQATAADIGRTLEAQRCVITLDIDLDTMPRVFEYCPAESLPLDKKPATVVMPIMLRHELVGTLSVQDKTSRRWGDEEVTFVRMMTGELALLLTSARLTAENQRRQREVSQLRALAKLTAEEADPFLLAQRLTEQALHLLNAEQGLVGFVRDETIQVEQFYHHGRWQQTFLEFRPGEGVAGWVLVHGRPYLSRHAKSDPQINHVFLQLFACQRVLAVPILNSGRILGVIELHNRRDQHPFDDEDVSYVQTIAHQIAIALERFHLFEEMERRTDALETLLAVSAELNEQLDPSSLIRNLVEHAVSLVGGMGGFGGVVETAVMHIGEYWQGGEWHELDDERGLRLAKRVMAAKQPYLTNDYRHEEEASQELMDRFDVRAALCVPIVNVNDQVLGFLEIHNKGDGRDPFSWADVGMMESLANAAAVAIGNTHLFKELDHQGAQLRALSAQLVTLLEDERRRIARELHDEAGQVLIGIKLNLRILAQQIPDDLPALRDDVDRLRQEVNKATERLQSLSRGLRPPTLDELGLEAALGRLTAEFEQTAGVPVQLETAVFPTRLRQPLEIACYRIVQEALTNIARHAEADSVSILLAQDAHTLWLKIRDDGQGFDLAQTPSAGLGLLGMRERANMLGGHFSIFSTLGAGTEIEVKIPLTNNLEMMGHE